MILISLLSVSIYPDSMLRKSVFSLFGKTGASHKKALPKPCPSLSEAMPKHVLILSISKKEKMYINCPNPYRNQSETMPKHVHTKMQKTDYPLWGYGSSILFPTHLEKNT